MPKQKVAFVNTYTVPLSNIGLISLYGALLLFGATNTIPAIISPSPKKMKPEQALKALQDNLAFGRITEEEYLAQRAEIISKL